MLPPSFHTPSTINPSSDQPHLRHIDSEQMIASMAQHHWLGCDIVLTDAGFHRIQDQLMPVPVGGASMAPRSITGSDRIPMPHANIQTPIV